MHPLLTRQLRRCHLLPPDPGLGCLLDLVDKAYEAADEDRRLLERSMELTSNELMQRNKELREALDRLQEADRSRRHFINSAAHELGTPLTPLKLQMHLLRTKRVTDERHLDMLERNIDRIIYLVHDLLDSAKIQTTRLRIEAQEVDLAQIIAAEVENVRPLADAAGLRVTASGPPQLPVRADARRIHQVLTNLLTNACKFTPAGGTIDVAWAQEDGMAAVSVHDTGQGLRPEDHGKLFEPFVQVHDTLHDAAPGTGLGLYICKGIIEASGGKITVQSPGVGRGTTFRFTLPMAE